MHHNLKVVHGHHAALQPVLLRLVWAVIFRAYYQVIDVVDLSALRQRSCRHWHLMISRRMTSLKMFVLLCQRAYTFFYPWVEAVQLTGRWLSQIPIWYCSSLHPRLQCFSWLLAYVGSLLLSLLLHRFSF